MKTFVIDGDYLSADFNNRFNLFSLVWGGKQIVDRVQAEKMRLRGYVAPVKPAAEWTPSELISYQQAALEANDGTTPPFDFADMYTALTVPITINQAAKSFNCNGTDYSFDGRVCSVIIDQERDVEVITRDKTPGQTVNVPPERSYPLAQIYYDRSEDELFVVALRRFQYQTIYTPSLGYDNMMTVRGTKLGVGSQSALVSMIERRFAKRWSLLTSPDYTTSIVQTRGIPTNQWYVLEEPQYISVPDKTKRVDFILSRFLTSGLDYSFKLDDFVVVQKPNGCVIEEIPGGMGVTFASSGVFEIVPKRASRIFLGEDVIRTSDLYLRLAVI